MKKEKNNLSELATINLIKVMIKLEQELAVLKENKIAVEQEIKKIKSGLNGGTLFSMFLAAAITIILAFFVF